MVEDKGLGTELDPDAQKVDEEFEVVQAEFEQAIDLAKKVQDEAAIEVRDHLGKNETDQCGYCGQCFGPDDIVIEKEVYGREWRFCNDECYSEFMDASNFKDEDLDGEPDIQVNIKKEE